MGKFVIEGWNCKIAVIEEVLYVLGMQCNLLSVEQLMQKGYYMIMKNNSLELFDRNHRLVLRYPFAKNITFQASMMTA